MSGNDSYADQIPKPDDLGVSSGKYLWDLMDDWWALEDYMDVLMDAKKYGPYGDNYFYKSGKCNNSSVEQCIGKNRYIYVRNVPTGTIPCSGGVRTDKKGLIPGIGEDMGDISPVEVFKSMMTDDPRITEKCVLRREQVGTPSNMRYERRCSPASKSPACSFEFFNGNQQQQEQRQEQLQNKIYKLVPNTKTYSMFIIIAIISIILLRWFN
jgi:hypothetical protein